MFSINSEQQAKVNDWLHSTVYPPILEKQREDPDLARFIMTIDGKDYPYFGAIGGGLTYQFTPTSLGVIMKVSSGDEELDITDYENW